MRVRVSARANSDLAEIGDYVARDSSPDRALALVDDLEVACHSLSDFPRRGIRMGGRGKDVRRLTHGSYLIVYVIGAEQIEIARILHGARDLSAIFGDEFD
jgi:toxin ParE1/3/4